MEAVPFAHRSRRAAVALAAAPLLLLAGCAASGDGGNGEDPAPGACEYPTTDIEFIVPYSSGGGFDTWARILAPALEEKLGGGVAIPVVNRPGAGGIVGVTEVFSAGTEGEQMVISEPGILATGLLSGTTDLDFATMEAAARVTVGPEVIVVAGDSPWDTIADAQAASEDGPLLMATGGLAAINIVTFDELGIPFENVIHEGSSEALLSIARGDTDIAIYPLSSVAEGIRGGDLKPLLLVGSMPGDENPDADAVEGAQSLDDAVDQPGLGAALEQHRMVLLAPGTDSCAVDTLSTAFGEVFEDEEFLAQLETAGLVAAFQPAEEAQETYDNTFEQLEQYQDILTEQLAG